jgi:hypothetical protein
MSRYFTAHSGLAAENPTMNFFRFGAKIDSFLKQQTQGVPMLKKLALAAAAIGALTLGSLSVATPSQAAASIVAAQPATVSNVVQAHWRRHHHRHRHCWWRHHRRHCVWR